MKSLGVNRIGGRTLPHGEERTLTWGVRKMRRTMLCLSVFAPLVSSCNRVSTETMGQGSARPSLSGSPNASASEEGPSTLPESVVGTWTGVTVNFPPGRLDYWPTVLEFTPCSLVPGEVCGSYVSCSADYSPGRVVTQNLEGGKGPVELPFDRTEGASLVFDSLYEDTYVTPLPSGDSLAVENVLSITSHAGDWDTYTLFRRVGSAGAARPFSDWRDSIESGQTCPFCRMTY